MIRCVSALFSSTRESNKHERSVVARAPGRSIHYLPIAPFPCAFGIMTQQPSWLDGLNAQQRAAATHGDGPVLVVAAPEAGKRERLPVV